ncbi:hypothetical protein BH24ACT3_BH24ACT3_00240 [soil metagenome]
MADSEPDPKSDRLGDDYTRGPNPSPGGEIELDEDRVPPYEGRTNAEGEDTHGEDESGADDSGEREA